MMMEMPLKQVMLESILGMVVLGIQLEMISMVESFNDESGKSISLSSDLV